jgi:hypothetical protein
LEEQGDQHREDPESAAEENPAGGAKDDGEPHRFDVVPRDEVPEEGWDKVSGRPAEEAA